MSVDQDLREIINFLLSIKFLLFHFKKISNYTILPYSFYSQLFVYPLLLLYLPNFIFFLSQRKNKSHQTRQKTHRKSEIWFLYKSCSSVVDIASPSPLEKLPFLSQHKSIVNDIFIKVWSLCILASFILGFYLHWVHTGLVCIVIVSMSLYVHQLYPIVSKDTSESLTNTCFPIDLSPHIFSIIGLWA